MGEGGILPRGISTFDKPRTFKGTSWDYYRLEAGTELPIGLALARDGYNRNYGALHYTIATACDMPLDHFNRSLKTTTLCFAWLDPPASPGDHGFGKNAARTVSLLRGSVFRETRNVSNAF